MKNFMTRANLVPRAFLAERGRAQNRLRQEKTLGTRRSSPTWLTLGLFLSFDLKCHYLLVRAKTSLFHFHPFKDGQHVSEFKREFLSEHAHLKALSGIVHIHGNGHFVKPTLFHSDVYDFSSIFIATFSKKLEFFASCRNWLILER